MRDNITDYWNHSDKLLKDGLKEIHGVPELAHFKQEGAPIHPDEIDTDMDEEEFSKWYDRQLKAYNDWYCDTFQRAWMQSWFNIYNPDGIELRSISHGHNWGEENIDID